MGVKLSLREEADNVKCAWRQPTNYTDCSNFPSWTSSVCFASCKVPSTPRTMPAPFVARIIYPRTTLVMLCHLPSLAEKSLFWSNCFQTIALANSSGIKYVPLLNFSHEEMERGLTFKLSTKLTWKGGDCSPLKHSYFQAHSCFRKKVFSY